MVSMGNHWQEANNRSNSSSATNRLSLSPFCYLHLEEQKKASGGKASTQPPDCNSPPSKRGRYVQKCLQPHLLLVTRTSEKIGPALHTDSSCESTELWPFLGAGKHFVQSERKELGLSSKLRKQVRGKGFVL